MIIQPESSAPNSAGSACSPLELIRQRTAQCHRALENALDWTHAFSSPQAYLCLLGRFLDVVKPLESCISQRLTSCPTGYDSAARTIHLQRDMDAVSWLISSDVRLSQSARDDCEASRFSPGTVTCTFIRDEPAAIGALYVLEGSALGGQLLAQQVSRSFQRWLSRSGDNVQPDLSVPKEYFSGRGPQTGQYWKNFCHWLNQRLADEQHARAAAQAATDTFSLFQSSLSGCRYA